MPIALGAVADDLTGATDLASTLVREGMRVAQVIGVPDAATAAEDAEAVVVALKTRTAPAETAVAQSLAALAWLRESGARQILFKYCSTFDSTPRGNIGPVADAMLAELGADFAFVCPAFPANGRTVLHGDLFVDDQPLSDSPMKDHPLTPMRDSNLVRLMEVQSRHKAGLVPLDTVRAGPEAIAARVAVLRLAGCAWGVTDAIEDDDLRVIGRAAADHALVTGGSGVAMGLPANLRAAGLIGAARAPDLPRIAGRAAVLAGSCSQATRRQIAHVAGRWPAFRLDFDRIASGADVAGEALVWAEALPGDLPALIAASAAPEEVRRNQARHGATGAGAMIEGTFAAIAAGLRAAGFRRFVVAGGETSGAVVAALGIRSLRIGPAIAPGVPWTEAPARGPGEPPLALALKSGNFGGDDFFETAFGMLP